VNLLAQARGEAVRRCVKLLAQARGEAVRRCVKLLAEARGEAVRRCVNAEGGTEDLRMFQGAAFIAASQAELVQRRETVSWLRTLSAVYCFLTGLEIIKQNDFLC
jgi:hypothetical protein